MVTKSKLRMALAAEKGVDFKKLKEKKKQKEAIKRKQAAEQSRGQPDDSDDDIEAEIEQEQEEAEDDDSEDDDEGEQFGNGVNLDGIDDSETSDSSVEMEERLPRQPKKSALSKTSNGAGKGDDDEDDDEEEEEDEEDIPMSDLEDLEAEDKEDIIPHQKLTINNASALTASLKRIAIPTDKTVAFATHQTVVSSNPTAESIPDAQDDLQRELAFYSQSLEAARYARTKLRSEGVPFSRPKDYFAEMVKEDAHMEKIKAKLVEEASNKKAAAEARKQRDLKKFGKQVQVAKLQERQKAKRETLEKINTLKRKRKESGNDVSTTEADLFDVGVDKELAKNGLRNGRSGAGRSAMSGGPNAKRQKKNEKYGFGGKKRHGKSGDAMSSSDLSGFNAKKMKAGGKVSKPSRPGKDRRKAMAGR